VENKNVGQATTSIVFNIQYYSIHDGPGIRTVVFLKGCPLSCLWCCNPESINGKPELGFRRSFCNECGECIEVCPQKALSLEEETNTLAIDRALCDNCGECVQACLHQALTIYGQKMTVAEVMHEVLNDAPFYHRSGGGVTISGGEPLKQPEFLLGILKGCRQAGLHTAIETSGYCSPRTLHRDLDEVDLFMFDLKGMDADYHLELIGRRNNLILENARLLAKAGATVQARMPLIPGVNDSVDNLSMLASFLRSIGWLSVELMPYHQFGRSKYAALGRPYNLGEVPSAKAQDVTRACELLKRDGIKCWSSS